MMQGEESGLEERDEGGHLQDWNDIIAEIEALLQRMDVENNLCNEVIRQ